MSVVIDWEAFFQVFVAALLGAASIVTFYALGLRLLVRSGRAPVVTPAEFTDAITVIGAYGCFALCAVAVIAGILIIVIGH